VSVDADGAGDPDESGHAAVGADPDSSDRVCSGSSIEFIRSVNELKNLGFELNIHLLTRKYRRRSVAVQALLFPARNS
jgi:uncharacterized protein YsxB (DUF464 family)